MNITIIYQDSDIVAVNKPAGISVHKGVAEKGETVADWLAENFPEIKKSRRPAGVAAGDCSSFGQRHFWRFGGGQKSKSF